MCIRDSSLGIGITTPSTSLHVIGQATVSGNVVLGGDLDVTGNAALNVIGQVTGDLTGNVNATTGVSTFKRLDLDTTSYYEFGELSAGSIGIGTTMGNFSLVINQDADMVAMARAFLSNPRWVWDAAKVLNHHIEVPPQYARRI